MDIMNLPMDMIENILSFLSYDEIAKNRIVSKSFNDICRRMLNRGFLMIERRHAQALKNMKAQLPRRESERRYHQLSRHCDILTAIETRISMLNMTYSKFIDHGFCCFIPGKVIDEIRRVLTIVETETTPPRAHEVLQELRDISSMAIEHFDDKISPAFRRKLHDGVQPLPRPHHAGLAPLALRDEFSRLKRITSVNSKFNLVMATQYKKMCRQMLHFKKISCKQVTIIQRMIRRQKNQEATIAELKKRIEECDIKYSELTHTNQAVGGKVAAAKATDVTSSPACHFSSQIKLDLSLPIGTSRRNANKVRTNIQPRKPVIKLPSLSEEDDEPPSKVPKQDDGPSTSHTTARSSSPKTKSQTTMANIRDIANQIRYLTNLQTFEDRLKHKRPLICDEIHGCKKLKKD